ncbi:RHS repeat-associated core domain-containing protein [Pseudomonas fluorescens]|uniref:Toxin n=1 Tax=Pseudomonas fluorescens TaxID=294 RepID=A0A423M7T0_PSEFL|nr:RHS repeat-associated core domain-containing protein [Pseudomonas fluorescens]RON78223.1 toxin [Pseudomonas fluorescens]
MTASEHWRTPTLAVSDGRGLPVRQVAYLRTATADAPQVNRQQYDAPGRLVAQWDPRLPIACLSTIYRLDGEPLKTASVDAGWRLLLPGLAGEPLQRWDARNGHWRTTFDEQLRVVAVEENGVADVDVFTYADATADPRFNRRGQLLEQKDRSGTLRTDSYALIGQTLSETRTFHDGEGFTSRRMFSPMGAVLEQTDAGGHRQQSRYGLAGQLRQEQLLISGQNQWQPVLLDAQYNAADQIIEQQAGNRVFSRWTYDPANGRLHTQSSRKDAGAVLQDFEYFYDPVGNITRIEDHAFQPVYFANQRVDGHRDFTYDSLYRLTRATGYDDAPPSDIPGLPQPGDPHNRLNYTQTYQYDAGNNLIELKHVRAGASHTCKMRIDPNSNRGLRWHPGDPEPDFDSLFDRHGNQQNLQPGQAMQWNARDELQRVTLIARDGTRDDAEHYRYSQGARVFKRHETFTDSAEHFHQVRYLPGLEIRSKDNGEELHVISLGSARCLHWAKNPPRHIDNNQLRYSLDDHLGSCGMELDQAAQLISHEGYYPFGATAWMAEKSATVSYKFIRYSGKEMDVSGLYYYGARYYAPWLQRWVSPDASPADGLNLYGFVGNNPMRYVDPDGNTRAEAVIMMTSRFQSAVNEHALQVRGQLFNILYPQGFEKTMALNTVAEGVTWFASTKKGGDLGSGFVQPLVPSVLEEMNFLTVSGMVGGAAGGDLSAAMIAPVAERVGLGFGPLIPQTSKMSVSAIDEGLGITGAVKEISSWTDVKEQLVDQTLNSVFNPDFMMNRVIGSWLSIVPHFLTLFTRAIEAQDIQNRLDPVKIAKIETMLADWKTAVQQRAAWAENAFDAAGTDVVYPGNVLPNVNHMTSAQTLAPITRSGMHEQTRSLLDNIAIDEAILGLYKERGTTDSQYMRRQTRTAMKRTG